MLDDPSVYPDPPPPPPWPVPPPSPPVAPSPPNPAPLSYAPAVLLIEYPALNPLSMVPLLVTSVPSEILNLIEPKSSHEPFP